MRQRCAFTLIELLIVVAIIAILAAIAVPNFLEAQTRAKVSRVKADFRTVATAVEAYIIDWNFYPPNQGPFLFEDLERRGGNITSPVAYMTSVPELDIFSVEMQVIGNPRGLYQYFNFSDATASNSTLIPPWVNQVGYPSRRAFGLISWGPDMDQSNGEHLAFSPSGLPGGTWNFSPASKPPSLYDPTNGTVSFGDIVRFGGSHESWIGAAP